MLNAIKPWKTLWFIPIFIFVISCGHSSEFEVIGTFTKADSTPVRLYLLGENSSELVDSTIYTYGSKKFKLRVNCSTPAFYLLKFFNDQTIFLVAHPGEKIKLTINNSSSVISYYVEGSNDTRRAKQITDKQNRILKSIDELSNEWETYKFDSIKMNKIDDAYHKLLLDYRDTTRKFIYSDPKSLTNILALYQNFGRKGQALFDKYDDLDLFSFIDSNLIALYPNCEAVKVLNAEVTEIKEQIVSQKYLDKVVKPGMLAPPFKVVTLNGDSISSGNINNSVLIIYFWASWNSYSVKELDILDGILKTYSSKDITVLTFSLDTKPDKLNEFIAGKDSSLQVVCDYKYWDSPWVSKYAVKRIPAIYLVDRLGIIVAKDIFGEELKQRTNDIIIQNK